MQGPARAVRRGRRQLKKGGESAAGEKVRNRVANGTERGNEGVVPLSSMPEAQGSPIIGHSSPLPILRISHVPAQRMRNTAAARAPARSGCRPGNVATSASAKIRLLPDLLPYAMATL